MSFFKQKNLLGVSAIIISLLLVAGVLLFSFRYFNMKEIDKLTSYCEKIQGEPVLEIHSDLLKSYSFECK